MQSLRVVSWEKIAAFVLVALSVAAWNVPVAVCQRLASISGQVKTEEGRIIPFGVMVRLENSRREMVDEVPADTNGHFSFSGLARVDYQLTVTADGFQTVTEEANLSHSAGSVRINVFLTPENKVHYKKGNITSVAELAIPRLAKKLFRKGERAFRARHYLKAQNYYEQATQEYSCYSGAQTQLATVLIIRKTNIPEAKQRLNKAIKCDATYLNAYEMLAQLLNAEGEYANSIKVLRQGLAHSPDMWQFHYEMGVAHYGMKDYGDAEKELQKALVLNKKPPAIVHIKLADVYTKESKYNDAYGQMEAYLRERPDGRFAARIRTVMKQMKAAGVLSSNSTPH